MLLELLFAFVSFDVDTETLSVIVELSASVGSTCTTSVKLPDVAPPLMTLLVVQVNEPVPPTAGGVQIHPAGAVIEMNVVFVGIVSVSVIVFDVGCVLTFVTSWVYVMFCPVNVGSGESLSVVISRSGKQASVSVATFDVTLHDALETMTRKYFVLSPDVAVYV